MIEKRIKIRNGIDPGGYKTTLIEALDDRIFYELANVCDQIVKSAGDPASFVLALKNELLEKLFSKTSVSSESSTSVSARSANFRIEAFLRPTGISSIHDIVLHQHGVSLRINRHEGEAYFRQFGMHIMNCGFVCGNLGS